MAEQVSHAAGQATYEVHEVPGEDRTDTLGILFRSADYAGAVEYAFDYLASHDPRREGLVGGLEVVKNDRGKRETVWTYSHATQGSRVDPLRRWGFDVTRNWHGPATHVRPLPLSRRITRRV
jgi:hypothetical protein